MAHYYEHLVLFFLQKVKNLEGMLYSLNSKKIIFIRFNFLIHISTEISERFREIKKEENINPPMTRGEL